MPGATRRALGGAALQSRKDAITDLACASDHTGRASGSLPAAAAGLMGRRLLIHKVGAPATRRRRLASNPAPLSTSRGAVLEGSRRNAHQCLLMACAWPRFEIRRTPAHIDPSPPLRCREARAALARSELSAGSRGPGSAPGSRPKVQTICDLTCGDAPPRVVLVLQEANESHTLASPAPRHHISALPRWRPRGPLGTRCGGTSARASQLSADRCTAKRAQRPVCLIRARLAGQEARLANNCYQCPGHAAMRSNYLCFSTQHGRPQAGSRRGYCVGRNRADMITWEVRRACRPGRHQTQQADTSRCKLELVLSIAVHRPRSAAPFHKHPPASHDDANTELREDMHHVSAFEQRRPAAPCRAHVRRRLQRPSASKGPPPPGELEAP
mmetsp:Transcript_74123/g.241012  ORF Transcript_74123/g.241012 Transcript_74123/m.241012 type:complete len:385 (+) Transcript_74123:741-1895(+)